MIMVTFFNVNILAPLKIAFVVQGLCVCYRQRQGWDHDINPDNKCFPKELLKRFIIP